MIHRINRILMTLAALLAVTTGAWAQGPTIWTGQVDVSELKEGHILAEGFSLTGDDDDDGFDLLNKRYKLNGVLNANARIIRINKIKSIGANCVITDTDDNNYAPADEYGDDGNAWIVTLVEDYGNHILIQIAGIYYDPDGVALTTNGDRTVWTIDKMPASDVELTVRYYDDAEVKGDAITATDVHIGEDKALLSGLSTKEGTLVYAITAATVTTAPADDKFNAANNSAKNKDITEAGTYRVWYYVDPDATHSPSVPAYKEVTVLTNKFDITFSAANTFDGTKATVSVKDGETDPVDMTDQIKGKLAGVTMGQTVILTAAEGYKIVGVYTKKAGESWVYNGPVAISSLQKGEILAQGFSLKGSDLDGIELEGDRHTCNGYVEPSYVGINLPGISSYGENCSFMVDGINTFEPYDGSQVGNAWEVTAAYSTSVLLSGITYTPLATINATKTVATMTMPACDVTLSYDLRRDLATETAVTVSIGGEQATADTRLRIAKDGNGNYQPVDALTCSFADTKESVTISDAQDILDAGLKPQFYLKGDNDSWTLVTDINAATHLPTNIAPGQTYQMTLAALDASIYTGETPRTVSITLYEGYEVTVPAQEYITYFKDEALTLGADETAAKLYTITDVGETTATATEYDVIPANTPMLVKNTSTETRSILLIPTTTTDVVNIYDGFKGTLAATTIAASDATTDRYAFNGKQFVWVKNALAVGANKAWLEVPVSTGSNARAITLVFDNATGIANTDRTDLTDGDYYDLNGRKLNGLPTKKGVYIQNGRKVVVK